MPEKILNKVRPWRLGLIGVSLLLFIMALTLMKEGAGSLATGLEETFDLSGVAHSLGFGWLAAMLVLSGSPVAAAALTFFDSGAIHELSALAMIMGTRIGAAFIVLAIGLVYVVRGRDRTKSLGIGVLALLVSATTYLPALPAGMAILRSGGLDWARVPGGGLPYKIVSHLFDPVEAFGGLDVLVNNAAVQYVQQDLEDITEEQLEKTFRTNIFSYFYMAQAALPHLKDGSSIINTTSITAYRGKEVLIDYASTKGAIVAFTRSLSQNVVDRGIRVNGVAPGPIWTPLIPASFSEEDVAEFGQSTPMGRAGQPEEVAPSYVFLAAQDAPYITGQVIHPNGGQIIGA